MSALLSKIRLYIKTFLRASWKFFTGIVVALIAFASNFTDFKQPDVTVEITSVATTSSDPIDLMRIPELSALREIIGGESPFFSSRTNTGLSVEEIERQIIISANRISVKTSDIDRQERQLNKLVSVPVQDQDQEAALRGLIDDIAPFSFPSTDSEPSKQSSVQDRIDFLTKKARQLIDNNRKQLTDLIGKEKEAETQWAGFKDTVLPNKARLIVTCAVGNKGAGATSLKPQGLLRANLGDGNYLDLAMKLSGYDTSADLSALQSQSYKVMRFQSEEVQSMNPADRQRFKTFLGNISPATLYIIDVRGSTYQSNSVPFSPGVYEQKVYDSLKQFASMAKTR